MYKIKMKYHLVKESNKQSKLLPQTGGAASESTSILAGMFALILGAIMFRRQKN